MIDILLGLYVCSVIAIWGRVYVEIRDGRLVLNSIISLALAMALSLSSLVRVYFSLLGIYSIKKEG